MRIQRLFPILLLAGLMAGCKSTHTPPVSQALAAEEESPFYAPVGKDIESAFQDIPRTQPQDVYQEYDGVKVVQFTVYSSGQMDKMTINRMTFDVVWVYDATRAGVVQYPLVLATPDEQGNCVPYYRPAFDPPDEWSDCQIYLQAIQPVIQRGHLLFPALTGGFVSPTGINWAECGKEVYCLTGAYFSGVYQDYDMDGSLLKRSLRRVPRGWALSWTWGAGEAFIQLPGGEQ